MAAQLQDLYQSQNMDTGNVQLQSHQILIHIEGFLALHWVYPGAARDHLYLAAH